MNPGKEQLSIRHEADMIPLRNRVKAYALQVGMNVVNQTKLITAVSELARNMLIYANGGEVTIDMVNNGAEPGVRLVFQDQGPGIADTTLALQDGYSTNRSLGLGLPGARRLVSEFVLDSTPGIGTTVTITKWQHG